MARTRYLYTTRQSYLYGAKHINDSFLNMGFDYKNKILIKGTSPKLWANPLQNSMYGTIETMITFILEEAKMIKKWMSIAHDKNNTNIN